MLDTIPAEILSNIAYHLSVDTLSPPVALLGTSKAIYDTISPQANPNLYARVFRANFDLGAAKRRLGQFDPDTLIKTKSRSKDKGKGKGKATGGEGNGSSSKYTVSIHAVNLVNELEQRVRTLRKLKQAVVDGDTSKVEDQDLWVVLIMLLENDRYNVVHLFTPNTFDFHLPEFIKLYHEANLLTAAIEPGYPDETVGRALLMWIAWLVSGLVSQYKFQIIPEQPEERDERLFVLRPYVFAAQQYEVFYAPWTISNLPLKGAEPIVWEDQPFVADLRPRARGVEIKHYGRTIQIAPPMLSHAAILRFFVKNHNNSTKAPGEEDDGSSNVAMPFSAMSGTTNPDQASQVLEHIVMDLSLDPALISSTHARHTDNLLADDSPVDASTFNGTILGGRHALLPAGLHDRRRRFRGGLDERATTHQPVNSHSESHDRDWARLRHCFDPQICRGMKVAAWKGSWNGNWEGNFSFFEFEAFREMLAGHSRALYEGPFGEQAQVWKMVETYVRPKRDLSKATRSASASLGGSRQSNGGGDESMGDKVDQIKSAAGHKNGNGKKRSGSDGESDSDQEEEESPVKGLPLTGPATNAGFPIDQPSSTKAGLSTPSAEAITLRETIKQQVEAIQGYEIVPPEEVDEAFGDDGGNSEGLEILLTGTGHSAWGRFILKGRVRAWDGMATLVKEYAPDSRGKWVYRGYILAGDVFVGRWRDTFTPEAYIGYEGTFILNRR